MGKHHANRYSYVALHVDLLSRRYLLADSISLSGSRCPKGREKTVHTNKLKQIHQ